MTTLNNQTIQPSAKLPPASPESGKSKTQQGKHHWQRYINGEWNPLHKPKAPETDKHIKCNF
jgi:hypothetical protein